jgi:hypothetical protein
MIISALHQPGGMSGVKFGVDKDGEPVMRLGFVNPTFAHAVESAATHSSR